MLGESYNSLTNMSRCASKDTKILTETQRLPSDSNHPPKLPARAGEEQVGWEPTHPPGGRWGGNSHTWFARYCG